jgi:hypothetical protein
MKTTVYISKYWDAVKGHKGFYYPSESSLELAFNCWVEGDIMSWLAPSNMVCLDTGVKLIFVLKKEIVSWS